MDENEKAQLVAALRRGSRVADMIAAALHKEPKLENLTMKEMAVGSLMFAISVALGAGFDRNGIAALAGMMEEATEAVTSRVAKKLRVTPSR
jgi:hypothetical protein